MYVTYGICWRGGNWTCKAFETPVVSNPNEFEHARTWAMRNLEKLCSDGEKADDIVAVAVIATDAEDH